MKEEKVYLTFPTDRETSEFLKAFAKMAGKTQPELINEICQDFKKMVLDYIKENNEQ